MYIHKYFKNASIYIHIDVYTYRHTHILGSICVCAYIYIHTNIYIYVCKYICVYKQLLRKMWKAMSIPHPDALVLMSVLCSHPNFGKFCC